MSLIFITDDQCFYGALVKQIKLLLKEREEIYNDTEWVLTEALNGRNLQSGGTFQNVLSRRLDEVVTPIFSALIAFVDQYSNLNLIGPKYACWLFCCLMNADIMYALFQEY